MSQPELINASRSKRGFSRVGNAFKCLRRFAIAQEEAKNPERKKEETADALIRGSLFHIGMAHHYAHTSITNQGAAFANGMEYTNHDQLLTAQEAVVELASREGPEWEERVQTILDALVSYKNQYGLDKQWEIMGIEHEYTMRLPKSAAFRGPDGGVIENKFPELTDAQRVYTQRADFVYREKATGKVIIGDHKTAYAMLSKTARQYILHGQFLGYVAIGKFTYKQDFAGVLLNRVKLSPYAADRMMVEPAPNAAANYVTNLVFMEQQIALYESMGLPADQWPASYHEEVCMSKYGQCPAMARCQWGHSQ